ncbi:hypothetical protein JXB22_00285 [candidate division WOR-3 bacterium]|nr:hypothetical protein [candidate division WOR-3 bacterium]
MDRTALNSYEEKGLPCPFIATRKGEVEIAQSGATLSKEISQMATVIFETIGAVGDIKIDGFEIMGSGKGLVLTLSDDQLAGALFARGEEKDIVAMRTLLQELHGQAPVAAPSAEPVKGEVEEVVVEEAAPEEVTTVEKEIEKEAVVEAKPEPEAKPIEPPKAIEKVKLEVNVLDSMKAVMKDFLGDFTERIYKNQLKAQRINVSELFDDDARRLVFALGKAAGMIIGPSKGRDMTNKLLEILK